MTTSFSLVHPSVNTVAVSLPTLTVSDKSNEYLRSDQMQLEDYGLALLLALLFLVWKVIEAQQEHQDHVLLEGTSILRTKGVVAIPELDASLRKIRQKGC